VSYLEHYGMGYGYYTEDGYHQGNKLWGPGTFYLPPGAMPSGPATHPAQATAVAQNGTVYYHHAQVKKHRTSLKMQFQWNLINC
jgi:hypothetical protein